MVSFSHRGIWINIISTLSSFCMKNWDCNLSIQTSFVFSVYVEGLNLKKCCTYTKSGSVLRRTWPNLILEQTILTYRKSYTHIHENFNSVTHKQWWTMLWNIAQILFAKMFIVIYTCLFSLKISYLHATYLGHFSPSLSSGFPSHFPNFMHFFKIFIYLLSVSNSIAHVWVVGGQPLGNWELTSSHTLKYQWFFLLNNHKVPISPQLGVGSQEPLPPLGWDVYLAWFVQVFEWVIIAALEFTCATVMSSRGQHFTILLPSSCSYILSASSSVIWGLANMRSGGSPERMHKKWIKSWVMHFINMGMALSRTHLLSCRNLAPSAPSR